MVKLTLINPANPLARITHFIPITPDGNANFPTLGPLHLAGIPDDKATAAITQAYRNTSLQVTVELSKNSTNFEITGDTILMPGSRSLADKPNMRLTDALPLAGDLGSADGLIIYRNFPFPRQIKIDLQKLRAGDPSLNLLIRPHDALYFTSPPGSQPTAKFPQDPNPHIYLLGEPSISGVYDSPTKSTLGNLLAAHHLTPNTHFLTLLRRDGLHRTLLLKNIEIPAKKSLPDDIAQTPLQSNDTILITLIPLNTPAQLPDIIPSIHPNQIGEYYISGTALPGVFSITGRSITALQALAYAGGLDHPESSYTVSLRRRQTPDKESLPLNNIPLQNLLTGTSPDIELQRNDFLLFTPATTPSTHPAPSLHAESEPREDSDSSLHPSPGSLTPFNVERAIAPLQIPRKTTNTDQFVRDPSTGTPIPAHPLFQPATAPLHLSPAASEPNPRLQFRSVLADNDPAPAIILIDNSSSPGQTLRLSKTILFTESDIAHADATTPDSVTFHFKPDAGKRFSDYTASHINHRLAILFDGKLLLAPNINSRIGPSGVLTFPHQQAAQIASALNIAKSPSTHPSTAPHAESETREDSDSSLRPNSAILPSDLLPTTAPYRLTADDFLQITLPDPSNPATKITQSRRISPTGTITLPNLNPLPIANLTLTQAQAAIANAYQEKNLLPNPQISIHIIENNENTYIIIGDGVTRAGQYPIYGHSFRLTDALTRAGGASPSSLITIIRNSDDHTARRIKIAASSLLAGDPSLNVIIHSHDCISVTDPTRKYIQLLISRDALTLNGKTLPKDESQFNITLYMALRDAIPSADRPQTTLIVAADSDYIPLTRYLSILNIATACAESLHFLPTSSIGVLPDNPRSATLPHIGAQPSTTQLSSSKSIKDSPSSRPIIPLTGEYYITGLANRPGVYSLSNRSINLAQALLAAGTIPDSASFLNLIRRTDNTESILVNNAPIKDILASPQNFPSIQPDDILTLSAEKLPPLAHPQQLILPAPNPAPTGEVYVAGHIARPGVYSISGRSITLRQILISAGCTDSPAPTYIRITRRLDSTHESNLTLSLLNILTGTDPDLYLQPNDIINFTSTPPSKQSTPTAQ
jgi:protein involved in polysaccharide export with SLBB domain